MNKIYTLYELQKVDLEIEAKEQELAQVLDRLGDDRGLPERRRALEEARGRAEGLEKRRQSLAWESEDLRAKIAPLEQKLYSGLIKVPKELLALQQDVEMLKTKCRGLEDAELQLMIELEEVQRWLREEGRELEKLEGQWTEEQQHLFQIKEALGGEIEALRGQRESTARRVDPGTLDTYQRIREKRQGLAVVSVERGTCGGCRITVPAIEMQRARLGQELIFCQSCGRILFVA